MQPSKYQRNICKTVNETSDNLIIQACAGSGKTTTLKMICEALPATARTIAVCFNKNIADEFGSKLPDYVEARTLHSLGFKIVLNNTPGKVKVNAKKVYDLLKKSGIDYEIRPSIKTLCSLARALSVDPNSITELKKIKVNYSVNNNFKDFKIIPEVLNQIRRFRREIDFDDMIDFPLYHNMSFPQYDYVLVDEAQDLNQQQLDFIERLSANGRIIAVGDRNQAIYGFRGALHTAMDNIRYHFNCKTLPLSVCYRCGQNIVSKAQEIIGEELIQAYEDNPPGKVEVVKKESYSQTISDLQPGDMVLCRTNAPLVEPCLRCITNGKKAVIRGKDIANGLLKLTDEVLNTYPKNLDEFTANLHTHINKKIEECLDLEQYGAVQKLEDKLDTILAVANQVDTPQDIPDAIRFIFQEQENEIIFSSIHKAKGLETGKVVLLAPEIIPHPMALKFGNDADLIQENNLRYVAYTRAKDELILQEMGMDE